MDSHIAQPTRSGRAWQQDLAGGLIGGVVATIFALSHAALLFPGELRDYLPYGIGLCLVTSMTGAFWMAWRSQLPFAVAGSDANTTSILAAAAATFTSLATTGKPVLENVLMLLLLTTLLCAAVFLVLGVGRLGSAVRYIPFPVIGGFLASTGWLIAVGALRVGADLSSDQDALGRIPSLLLNPQWLVTFALGCVFLLVFRRWRHPAVLPAVLMLASLALLGILAAAGISPQAARESGWVFTGSATARWLPPWELMRHAGSIDWDWIARQWLDMVAVATVGVITVLLGATGLEVMSRRDISLDRELRTHGWLNVVSSLIGGYVSLISVSRSAVLLASTSSRAAAFSVAAVCAAVAPVATPLVGWVPRPVLGGFLLSIGLGILWEWVVKSRARTSLADWALIIVILGTAATIGFTVSVIVGILASCLNFALSYSRVGVVQHDLDGTGIVSSVSRPAAQQELLAAHGTSIRVLVLRGVMFFGTANSLLERVRPFLEGKTAGTGLRALVLDFTHVASIDSSAAMTFSKIAQLAQLHGTRLMVCGTSDLSVLEAAGDASYATLDQALDAAEEAILAVSGTDSTIVRVPIGPWLSRDLGGEHHWRALEPLLLRREVAARDILLHQGDKSDTTLYLIESGRLAVTLRGQEDGQRLACLMAGNIVGEMALYSNINRSATVTAETDAVVWALPRSALESLQAASPDTTLRVHAFVMQTMARRIQRANATIAALHRGA
ncbi:MAG: SulP family inorganic anion transporter [Pseudomonadota bacterium]